MTQVLGTFLDNIALGIHTQSMNWRSVMMDGALYIFGVMWFFYTMWRLLLLYLQRKSAEMVTFLFTRCFTAGVMLYWIKNPWVFEGINNYFTSLGLKASGLSAGIGDKNFALKPSTIVNFADILNATTMKYLQDANWTDMVRTLVVMCSMFFVNICLVIMAMMVLITQLQSYIVFSGGLVLLGFIGSEWTKSYAESYIKYCIGIAVQLMMLCLVAGLILPEMTKAMTLIQTASFTSPEFLTTLFELPVKMLAFTVLIILVPSMTSSALSGHINSGVGAVVATAGAMMSAGGGIMGALKSGGGTVKSATDAISSLATGKTAGGNIKAAGQKVSDMAAAVGDTMRKNKGSTGKAMGNSTFGDFMKESAQSAAKKGIDRSSGVKGGADDKSNSAKAMEHIKSAGSSAKKTTSAVSKIGSAAGNVGKSMEGINSGSGPRLGG